MTSKIFLVLLVGILIIAPALAGPSVVSSETTFGLSVPGYPEKEFVTPGFFGTTISIVARVYQQCSTCIFTYVYELTSTGGLLSLTVNALFDPNESWGVVGTQNDYLANATFGGNLTFIFGSGLPADTTILLFAKSYLAPGYVPFWGFPPSTVGGVYGPHTYVPEPASLSFLTIGLLVAGFFRKRLFS